MIQIARLPWVDEHFRQWLRGRIVIKPDEGRVDALMPVEDFVLRVGLQWVQIGARGFVDMPEQRALEVFSLCMIYARVDQIDPVETLAQCLQACRRFDSRIVRE